MLKKIMVLTMIRLQIMAVDTEIQSIDNSKDAQTISYYNDHAQLWVANYGSETKQSFWAEEISMFKKYVPQGSMLEIGLGGACEAAEFIKHGYTYTGIDAAANLIEIAQKRFPTSTFHHQNIYDLDISHGIFDSFWCAAVFLHIPSDSIDLALQKIKTVMKPGAIGFISLAQGNGEYFDEATGRYFYLYAQDEFINILHKNGFIIEESHIRQQDTSRAWLRSWLTFFIRVI